MFTYRLCRHQETYRYVLVRYRERSPERRAFLEICDERYQSKATLLTSQLPVAKWHGQIGDPTVADSILDRLVHAAHRLEMQGESMRKKKAGRNEKNGE